MNWHTTNRLLSRLKSTSRPATTYISWCKAGAVVLVLLVPLSIWAQHTASDLADSDHDGLSDLEEQALLEHFKPAFMVSKSDCDLIPSEFQSGDSQPNAILKNGTIYGQATPRQDHPGGDSWVELRYFHLWQKDCGSIPHPLDAEHVSVLIYRQNTERKATLKHVSNFITPLSEWRAVYWYAAAHENTMCDASQITTARFIDAETHGPRVWISSGKHASFLDPQLCTKGCGGDRCGNTQELEGNAIINMGEPGALMNGSQWVNSTAWQLLPKMQRTDFPFAAELRVDLHPSAILWVNPSKRPTELTLGAMVNSSGSTNDAIALSERNTGNALGRAADSTGNALGKTGAATGNALGKTGAATGDALGKTGAATGDALNDSYNGVKKGVGRSLHQATGWIHGSTSSPASSKP